MNKFEEFFKTNQNTLQISKWHHYFDVYERHFNKYKGTNPTILEIGTAAGGGTELLSQYFDGNCKIVTFDISDEGKPVTKFPNITFLQGSQNDITFLNELKSKYPKFDIILDDGGHGMEQQITSFNELYSTLSDNGTYLIEDVHTSYWPAYNGGVERSNTFIEYTKKLVDKLNVWHWQQPFNKNDLTFCKQTDSIHYYDSIVVVEKRSPKDKPMCEGKNGSVGGGRIWDDNCNWMNNLK